MRSDQPSALGSADEGVAAVVAALLAELLGEQRATRIAVERLCELLADRRPLPANRLSAAQDLLRAVAVHFGDTVVTAAELVGFVCERISSRAALLEALEAAVGTLDAGAPRRLGKLFRGVAGRNLGGYRVDRLEGHDRAGALWIVRVCAPTKPAETRSSA